MHQKKRKLNSIRLTLAVVILYHCIRQKKEHESEAQKLRHHIANKVFENRINKHFSARIPDIDDSSEIEGQEIQRTPRKVTILYNSAPNATVNIPASPSTRDQDSNSGSGQKQKRRGSKKKMKTMINSKGKVSIRDVKKASGLTENFVHLDDILTTERTTESVSNLNSTH
ncbi:hypothetical protein QR680_012302 [Steinernema hermaphroditum]|uniref:Uncharacterized protein n=1 Tax=Steinernema hermaphroditum TaxID=289476 RepID=A0AA39I2Y2_9BILA|nr:hypothetical protein QR680_012302 [Steinernema hermaphroditum]